MHIIPVVSPYLGWNIPRRGRGQACGDPPQLLCAAVDVAFDAQNGGVPLDGAVLLARSAESGGKSFWMVFGDVRMFMMF